MKAVAQHGQARKGVHSTVANGAALLLQRKCACGAAASTLTGECAECKGALGVQRKLAMGSSNDPLEREADRMADRVVGGAPAAAAGGAPLRVQRAAQQPVGASGVPATVERALASAGRPLDAPLRHEMERSFGHDFSRVRVHTDDAAAQSAQAVQAHAYTAGTHIVFGARQFAPATRAGRHLLAHELTHVLQQAVQPGQQGGTGATLMRKGFDSTIEICHRVLETRKFEVTQGGLRVVIAAEHADRSVPDCKEFDFAVALNRSKDWRFDKEVGTCEAGTGGTRVFSFGNLPTGTYYLTISRNFDHPYCCMRGDIMVFDEPVTSDSSGCQRSKDLSTMDIVHAGLDLAGFIPVLGAIPDGINAGIYVVDGDWANAGLSLVAAIPAWGDGVKLVTIAGKSTLKVSAKAAVRLGPKGIAEGLKEVKAASEGIKLAEEAGKAAKVEKGIGKGARELEQKAAQQLEKEAAEKAAKEKPGATREKSPEPESKPKEKEQEKADGKEKEQEKAGEKEKEKKKKKKGPKCTPLEITAMNKAMHVFCDTPRSCSMQGDTCASAMAKVSAGYGCVDGRAVLQQKCYSPGDPGYETHMKMIAEAYAALRNCEAIVRAKCT